MTDVLRFGLAGSFTDAFIYRTQLYAIMPSGDLRIYEVSDIEQALSRDIGDLGRAIGYLMFHTRGIGSSQGQQGAFRELLDQEGYLDAPTTWLPGGSLSYRTVALGVKGHSVLDILIYYDRLYVATGEGLLAAPIPPHTGSLGLESLLSYACFSAKVSLGAVAASCGDNGLNMIYDDLSWFGHRQAQVAEPYSIRASYVGLGLANYTSNSRFRLLNAEVEESQENPKGPRARAITRLGATEFTSEAVLEKLSELTGIRQGSDYTFNYGSTFVVFCDGEAYVIPIRRYGANDRRTLRPRVAGRYEGRIVGAQLFGDNVLLETQEAVHVLAPDGMQLVHDGPVASLRVFPLSKRYQDLAIISAERGLVFAAPGPRRRLRMEDAGLSWEDDSA